MWARKGDYDRAVADCTDAIRLEPRFAGALWGRAAVYCEKKEYETAIRDCSDAIRLEPKFAGAY